MGDRNKNSYKLTRVSSFLYTNCPTSPLEKGSYSTRIPTPENGSYRTRSPTPENGNYRTKTPTPENGSYWTRTSTPENGRYRTRIPPPENRSHGTRTPTTRTPPPENGSHRTWTPPARTPPPETVSVTIKNECIVNSLQTPSLSPSLSLMETGDLDAAAMVDVDSVAQALPFDMVLMV